MSWFDPFTTARIWTKIFHWPSVLFTSFARAETDGQIHNAGCISTLFLEKTAKITKSFCIGIIPIPIIPTDNLLIACIFSHPFGAWKNTKQLAKYPCVLYVKPSNKIYIYLPSPWHLHCRTDNTNTSSSLWQQLMAAALPVIAELHYG